MRRQWRSMRKSGRQLFAGPYLIWIIGFILLPLAMIIYYAFTTSGGTFTFENVAAIADPVHVRSILLSLKLGIICTLVCLLLAYPLAMILNGLKIKQQNFVVFIFILPMWMNFMLRILAWRLLLSNNGIVNAIFQFFGFGTVKMLNTQTAVVFGMVYDFLPFMILPLYTTLSKMDNSLIEAAADLGASHGAAFFKVTVPLSVPGIISGVTMVFLPAMTNYVILDMLYNSTYIMGSLIGSYFNAYDWHSGSMISIVLLIIIFIITLATNGLGEEDTNRGAIL